MTSKKRKVGDNDGPFTMRIHYGGKFFNRPTTRYEDGKVDLCENCQPDKMSLLLIGDIASQLGYKGMVNYYYVMAGKTLYNGLRMIVTDSDVMEMIAQLPPPRLVDLYMEAITPIEINQSQCSSCPQPLETQGTTDCPIVVEHEDGQDNEGGPSTGTFNDVNFEDIPVDDVNFEDIPVEDIPVDDANYNDVGVEDVSGNRSDSDASFFVDSDYEQSDVDDDLFDVNVDKQAEWGGVGEDQDFNVDLEVASDGSTDYGDDSADDLHSVYSNSDDEANKQSYQEYRRETDLGKVEFKVGMKFSSAKEFREAVREYAIKEGKSIKFVKNETTRVQVVCNTKHMDVNAVICQWTIGGSLSQRGESFQVKTYKGIHDCLRTFKVKSVTSNYLAQKYMEDIRSNPNMPLQHLVQRVRRDLVVDVTLNQAYRARTKALKLIEGTNMEQFGRLRDYCEELRRTNPNTTIVLKTIPPPTLDGQPTFERLYICLGALKEGMLAGCRRIVCLDACHLKGPNGGQMAVAVGIDANNQSFPFAYAVVESETKESWVWFIELVVEDLKIQNSGAWTFISDKQKGLIPALLQVVPNAEIRFCTRHLYQNFKDQHRGIELKNILWQAARATTVQEFHTAMAKMKSIDVDAYNWLAEKPPQQWSRSHFSTFNTCDLLVNNLCEGFNKDIRKARDKPIVTMLEGVRCYLMRRMTKRRQNINTWEHAVCPNIIKKVEKYMKMSGGCNAIWCGEGHFQVYCSNLEQYSLNLDNHTCSCRRWELRGIPCVHAITAISFKHENIVDYIHPCYKKETNVNIYKGIVYPINGWTMWPDSGCVPLLPPNYGRPAGRPRKCRRKSRAELEEPSGHKLKRCGTSLRCGKCGQWGHNRVTCKNEANPDIRQRPSGGYVFNRPTGRPRGRPRGGGVVMPSRRGRIFTSQGTQASSTGGDGAGMGSAGAGRGFGSAPGRGSASGRGSGPGRRSGAGRGSGAGAGAGRGSRGGRGSGFAAGGSNSGGANGSQAGGRGSGGGSKRGLGRGRGGGRTKGTPPNQATKPTPPAP